MSSSCVLGVVLPILSVLEVVRGDGVVVRIVMEAFTIVVLMLHYLEMAFHGMLVGILKLL